jgi:hypothetical protein
MVYTHLYERIDNLQFRKEVLSGTSKNSWAFAQEFLFPGVLDFDPHLALNFKRCFGNRREVPMELLKGPEPQRKDSGENVVWAWGLHLVALKSSSVNILYVYTGLTPPEIGERVSESSSRLYTALGIGERPELPAAVSWVFKEKFPDVNKSLFRLRESGEAPQYRGAISREVKNLFEKSSILRVILEETAD